MSPYELTAKCNSQNQHDQPVRERSLYLNCCLFEVLRYSTKNGIFCWWIEAEKIISLAVKISKNTIKIIVGAGSNNTELAIKKSKQAQNLGADAILSVNPYYNKPPQEGLYKHFEQIADSIDIPMILYNIKGRTAVNLEIETLLRLSRHKNIIGVKEASGDLSQIMDVISQVDNDFFVSKFCK